MEYKNYHATFHRNILNIYNTNNKLLSSKSYSNIIYENEYEKLFKSSVDSINRNTDNNLNTNLSII